MRLIKVLSAGLLLVSCSFAQVSFPAIQTSANRRFIEHTGREKTLQGQLLAARNEAQRLLNQGNPAPCAIGDYCFVKLQVSGLN